MKAWVVIVVTVVVFAFRRPSVRIPLRHPKFCGVTEGKKSPPGLNERRLLTC